MSELEKPFDIPEHWDWSTFDEIGEWTGGGTPSKQKTSYWKGDIPWVSPKDMKRLVIDGTQDHVTETALEDSATNRVPADSLLFVTRSGILERKLPTARAAVSVTINQDLKALDLAEGVDSRFLLYYTRAAERSILRQCSKHGTTVASLESGRLYRFPVPLPPLPEQRRIVAKIEELFSNLDAGMADLQTAGQQLERYRLSVLQAAVEGRLTADWRRTHDPEPADQLLKRILEKRRKKWEERYKWERYESKGKEPPSGWKDRYTEPDPPDDTDLRELPEGWTWSRLGHAFFVHLGATPRRSRDDFWGGDIAWASSSEINQREITHTEETITKAGLEDTSTQVLSPGTLMLGMIGQGRTRGMVAELKIPAATSQNSAAIEVEHSPVPTKWVFYYLESQYHELRRMGSGNNQKALNKGIVEKIPIPIPPLAEQKQIVDEVERLLSVADDATAIAEREHTRAERLRQSILKQAFSGQLVPHDEDAAPPAIESSSYDGSASSASGDTDPSSDEDDVVAEELYNGGDPGKQIEMDL